MLAIKEKRPGRERVAFVARGFASGLPRADLGDPVGGATAYRLCIYDATEQLVGLLEVDRAGALCGPKDAACWQAVGTRGYRYHDKASSADGVKRLVAKGGASGKGSVRLKAGNVARKGRESLPTGLAAMLAGNDGATVQVVTSDAGCVSAPLERVKKADEAIFKAKTQR